MRSVALLAGFVAVAAASPVAQAIDFSSVNAAPSPSLTGPPRGVNSQNIPLNTASVGTRGSAAVTGVASASATVSQAPNARRGALWGWPWVHTTSSDASCPTQPEAGTYCGFINPEDACAPQPDGYGPQVIPDTVEAFEAYPDFGTQALAAQAPGYAATFRNLNASVSANTYLGLTTLKTYSAPLCAQHCDNTTLCTGFNIYVERDPSLNPSDNCTQPASITNYKCTLWGSGVNAQSATNFGDYRGAFHVVVAGSDGFEKTNTTTPASQPGWQAPKQCGADGSTAHNHPSTCMGSRFFPGPYNPALCAAPYKCSFFNSYMLKKNGHHLGTYCSLHSQQYSGAVASYSPGWQGSDFWSVESSWSYSINA
ncbi:hypothetical protein PZA11_004709 [Diplocarpon coronariae]